MEDPRWLAGVDRGIRSISSCCLMRWYSPRDAGTEITTKMVETHSDFADLVYNVDLRKFHFNGWYTQLKTD